MKVLSKIRQKQHEGNHPKAIKVEDAEEHTCLNCGTVFRGNYCPGCQQKASTGRICISTALKTIFSIFSKMDSGLLHTIIDLLYRPGYMVRDYLQGRRTEYINPVKLLIILAGLCMIIPDSVQDELNLPAAWSKLLVNYPISMFVAKTWIWIWSNAQRACFYISILCTPLIYLFIRLLRLKEKRLNLSETLYIMLYGCCTIILFGVVSQIIVLLFPTPYRNELYSLLNHVQFIYFLVISIIMVRDCCSLKRLKLVIFCILCFLTMIVFLNTICTIVPELLMYLELPPDIFNQIDLLYIMK